MKKGFFIHSFKDETSMFDPNGKWEPGGEYYSLEIFVWIPNKLKGDDDKIDAYIEKNLDNKKLYLTREEEFKFKQLGNWEG